MRPVLKVFLFLFDHPQVRFMDEGRGLQGVPGVLLAHIAPGHLPQFLVNEWHQLVERCTITIIPLL
jgi:hypothetical protein